MLTLKTKTKIKKRDKGQTANAQSNRTFSFLNDKNSNSSPSGALTNTFLYNNASSPVFSGKGSGDAAANDWANRYNPESIQSNQEMHSFLFSTNVNGNVVLSYTEPTVGGTDKSGGAWSTVGVAKLYGDIHSHGAYDSRYDNNNFSNDPIGGHGDIQDDNKTGVTGYISTPNGTLQKYVPALGTTTIINQTIPSDSKDPDRKNNIPADKPAPKTP